MSLVLALEPDPKQAAVLKQVVRDRVGAEFVLADSKDAALAAIGERVPDLILVTTLLSPRDESELTDRLRGLEGAEHLQTLTIPLLAAGAAAEPKKKRRGLLSALTGDTAAPAAPSGCDPAVFAEEIRNYISRAEELKVHASAERDRKRVSRRKKATEAEPSTIDAPLPAGSVEGGVPAAGVSGPQSSYWTWDAAPAPGASAPKNADAPSPSSVATAHPSEPALAGGYSSWANPWDVSHAPAAPAAPAVAEPGPSHPVENAESPPWEAAPREGAPPAADPSTSTWSAQARAALEGLASQRATYLDDHELSTLDAMPVTVDTAAEALFEQPAAPTAAELVERLPAADDEIDLSALLDGSDRAHAEPSSPSNDVYVLSSDAFDLNAFLDRPASGADADAAPNQEAVPPAAVSESDRAALLELQADVDRLRSDRESAEHALAEARAAQERAEAAAAQATAFARDQAERHAEELAARARHDAAAEGKAREREERKAREEAELRAGTERQAREEFERLTREFEARMRAEAEAERRLREEAERAVADAEARRAKEVAERQAGEEAERRARAAAEAQAAAERRAREEAEARAEAERRAREEAERKAREQAEQVAREAEERRAREAAELKAREEAERKARKEAEARADLERRAREEAERKAREQAEQIARDAEERRAREAVERKAREEEARKAREEAERRNREETEARIEAERKARRDAERQAKHEAERRAEAERRTREEAERLAAEAAARAREEARAERKAREQAERRAAEERKAREQAERRAREESSRRAAAEARARQEEARHRLEAERRAKAPARPKKAVVVRRGRRKPEPEPIRDHHPKRDPARPTQDEWGLYDPDKAGFGALFAKLEAIENGEIAQDEPSAADLLAEAEGARGPRPLSMWVWRADEVVDRPGPPSDPANPDDFRGLVDRLRIPAAVASVGYATGARIRRVKIQPGRKPARGKNEETHVIILSRKMLKAVRAEATPPPALTARR